MSAATPASILSSWRSAGPMSSPSITTSATSSRPSGRTRSSTTYGVASSSARLTHLEETFDLVSSSGVLYHLRYPLLGLDLVAERCRRTLVLQTLTMPQGEAEGAVPEDVDLDDRGRLGRGNWPTMAFVEHRLAGDPTNWWVPTPAVVEAMVRTVGMTVVGRPGEDVWMCTRTGDLPRREELEQASGRGR
jgi:hypothetical protein